eukprot:CAMPEP_0181320424 /NCGR_PEP_ID=MMETSP1101-20121128/18118_1 /TAXON_ID=46948 /ORGANISM="Rhodomonas abbreviata, Strain Caron Lab Isolate" /LENGTH=125 /DNA_ID=CAMNT_0023428131 /DNA_START=26 /DNA_END=403 /DNA_ORIENTATION=+
MPKDLAEFGGILKVKVVKIEGFAETAGFMDKTDPFVELKMGEETFKTAVKNNAGGSAEFNEQFCFDKQEGEQTMRLRVLDSDTLSNDLLGSRDIDLDDSSTGNGWYTVVSNGKETGKVFLEFAYD